MNEKIPKKAMEGRTHNAAGEDIGDAQFHEQGWNTTPEETAEDIERVAAAEVDLAERQVEVLN